MNPEKVSPNIYNLNIAPFAEFKQKQQTNKDNGTQWYSLPEWASPIFQKTKQELYTSRCKSGMAFPTYSHIL